MGLPGARQSVSVATCAACGGALRGGRASRRAREGFYESGAALLLQAPGLDPTEFTEYTLEQAHVY